MNSTDQARRYLAEIPGAISGSGGHDATYRAAMVLVQDFALPEADALTILRQWNVTCSPPWPESDLLHKVRSAIEAIDPAKLGCKASGNGRVAAPVDPVECLSGVRGWSAAALLALGARADGGQVLFPMCDAAGAVTGWRRRRGDGTPYRTRNGNSKALTVAGGHNGVMGTWPMPDGDALLAEGEMDGAAGINAKWTGPVLATPGSSPGKKVDEDLQRVLAGRRVFMAPDPDQDNDKSRSWRTRIARNLTRAGCEVFIIPAVNDLDLDKRLRLVSDQAAELARLKAGALPWRDPKDAEPPREGGAGQRRATAEDDVEGVRAKLWAVFQTPKLTPSERTRAIAAAVVTWLHERGRFYFHNERRDFATLMYFDGARKLLLPVQSDAFNAWLADALAINRTERTFAYIHAAIEDEGLSERSTGIAPAAYWASSKGNIYLSNGPGRMAKVAPGHVELVDNGTDGVLFPYGATLPEWALVAPVDPFEACSLFRDMSTEAAHGKDLLRFWVTGLPSDQRTKPPLAVSGEVGAGKTRVLTGIFELYGIPPRIGKALANGEADFWAALDIGGLLCIDNADTRIDWLADALAAASTGGTLEKRKLYTDADKVSLKARSWICVSSANPTFAADAGLADRLLVIRLARRQGQTAEATLSAEILRHRDAALSWICQALASALADTGPIPQNLNARHPDFAALAVKIGRAIGREAEVVAALRAAESDKSRFNLENDQVGAALLELVDGGDFHGTAAELLEALKKIDSNLDGRMSTKRLGKRLAKLWTHLESTLGATSNNEYQGGHRHYSFTDKYKQGDFSLFKSGFPVKSPYEMKINTLYENPSESHYNHSDSAKPGELVEAKDLLERLSARGVIVRLDDGDRVVVLGTLTDAERAELDRLHDAIREILIAEKEKDDALPF